MDATRYPLSWPFGWKRTLPRERSRARFKRHTKTTLADGGTISTKEGLTVAGAMNRLRGELGRLGAADWLVSSNVEITTYGEPRSGRPAPSDPGVAVYFRLNGKDRVLACDRWDQVQGNIAAIAQHIDAIRRIDRYGVGTLDQAFAGYDALPPPGATNRPPWRKVFGIPDDMPATPLAVNETYRELARKFHPDVPGGSHEAMAQLNEARDAALQEMAQ